MIKPTKSLLAQRRLRSALASAQSDQSLRCALNEKLRTQAFLMRTAKTLIRLWGCPGWSESSLGAHAILLVLSWANSNLIQTLICSSRGLWNLRSKQWLDSVRILGWFLSLHIVIIGIFVFLIRCTSSWNNNRWIIGTDLFNFVSNVFAIFVRQMLSWKLIAGKWYRQNTKN